MEFTFTIPAGGAIIGPLPVGLSSSGGATVAWGDTTTTSISDTHTYSAGTYTATVTLNAGVTIVSFGSTAAWGAQYLTGVSSVLPATITSLANAFYGATNFNGDISGWNTSAVTAMNGMFSGATLFNRNIGSWNVANVTTMQHMFANTAAMSVKNYDALLNGWATQNVKSSVIFDAPLLYFSPDGLDSRNTLRSKSWIITDGEIKVCTLTFTIPYGGATIGPIPIGISSGECVVNWGNGVSTYLSNTQYLSGGTYDVTIYPFPGVSMVSFGSTASWGQQYLTDFPYLPYTITSLANAFYGATQFNGAISGWDTSAVTNMSGMFNGARVFNRNIGSWNVTNVTSMQNMLAANAAMSTANYDALLNGWASQSVKTGVRLDAPLLYYSRGSASSRATLTAKSWAITDLGMINLRFTFVVPAGATIGPLPLGLPSEAVSVDWGDGSTSANVTHTYLAGTYTATVTPEAGIAFVSLGSTAAWGAQYLTGISSVLPATITSLANAFYGATQFNGDISGWNTSAVTAMNGMFQNANAFNRNIGSWNVTNVTTMQNMFAGTSAMSVKNYDALLNGWATQNVKTRVTFDAPLLYFSYDGLNSRNTLRSKSWIITDGEIKVCTLTFTIPYGGATIGPIPIGISSGECVVNWGGVSTYLSNTHYLSGGTYDVTIYPNTGVTMLSFGSTASWGQQYLTGFSYLPYTITSLANAFYGATAFNGAISTWDTSAVTNMSGMFQNANAFNQNISTWDTSAVTNMSGMFQNAIAFNQNIGTLNTSAVKNMSGMFQNAIAFNQNIGSWNVTNVTSMQNMFAENAAMSTANYDALLVGWASQSVKTGVRLDAPLLYYSRGSASSRATLTAKSWAITDLGMMNLQFTFTIPAGATIGPLPLGLPSGAVSVDWGDGNTNTDVSHTYSAGTYTAIVIPESSAGFASLGSTAAWGAQYLTGFSSVLPPSITSLANAFYGATQFNGDISGWNTSAVTAMNSMFQNANAFNRNIGSWNITNVTSMQNMFAGTSAMSVPNYDALLNGWAAQNVKSSVTFDAPLLYYSPDGLTARNTLRSKSWAITDNAIQLFTLTFTIPYGGATIGPMPIVLSSGNGVVNWGDGVSSYITNEHRYFMPGTYTVTVYPNPGVTTVSFGSAAPWGQQYLTEFPYLPYSITSLANAFYGATQFNGDISGWNTSAVTNMSGMFQNANAFNRNIGSWNVTNVTSMQNIFAGNAAMNTANYDALLNGWASQSVKTGITFDAPLLYYSRGGASSRARLTAKSWTITDRGMMNLQFTFVIQTRATIGPLPLNLPPGAVSVNWGDGSTSTNIPHMYSVGTYTATVTPEAGTIFASLGSTDAWGAQYLTGISAVLPPSITSLANAFYGATQFNGDISGWNTSAVTAMNGMFSGATLFNRNIGGWNTSAVTTMNGMFQNANAFNRNIGSWNITNVTSMQNMFAGTSGMVVTNYDALLIGWAAQNVQSSVVFDAPLLYYSPDGISARNTLRSKSWAITDGEIKVFTLTFIIPYGGATIGPIPIVLSSGECVVNWGEVSTYLGNPQQLNPGTYNVSIYPYPGVTMLSFGSTASWGQKYLTDISYLPYSITSLANAFHGATAFNGDISTWDTSAVTNMNGMFSGATIFNRNIGGWNVVNVTSMQNMFAGTSAMSIANYDALLNGWGSQSVKAGVTLDAPLLYYSQSGASSRGTLAKSWNITDLGTKNLSLTFTIPEGGATIGAIPIGLSSGSASISWGDGSTSANVPHTYSAGTYNALITMNPFASFVSFGSTAAWGQQYLTGISSFLPSTIRSLANAFNSATLFNGDISGWDTSAVNAMNSMFQSASAFNQNIGGWNIVNVTSMQNMFADNSVLSIANYNALLNGWALQSVKPGVTFDAPLLYYSQGGANSRNTLTSSPKNWTINDFGKFTFPDPTPRPTQTFTLTFTAPRGTIIGPLPIGLSSGDAEINWGDGFISGISSSHANQIESTTFDVTITSDPGVTFVSFGANAAWGQQYLTGITSTLPPTITSLAYAFNGATSFNGDITAWDTSAVTAMNSMFDGATIFNRNLGGWNVANVDTMANMFAGTSAMSVSNYDALLMGWAALPSVKSNITFDAPYLKRTTASDAAVTTLSSQPNNWTISDGGINQPCFVTGTRILTPSGYVPVESLATGDHILTADGRSVAITWYEFHLPSTTVKTAPFRIAAGALGPNLPARDIYLSGQHMVKDADGIWQKTQDLATKNPCVIQYDVGKDVTYYHIECPDYYTDDLQTEDVVVESYYRNWKKGTTLYSANGAGFTRNYPQKT